MLQNLCSDPTRLAVLLWVGFGPGALAAFLQAAGQQHVAPAQAQVRVREDQQGVEGREWGG